MITQLTLLPELLPDNDVEPRVRRPSVPVAKFIAGRWCWLKFGTNNYQHEPELEAILLAARRARRKAARAAQEDRMNHEYPTAEELALMGATLQHDVCLWTDRLTREYCQASSSAIYTRSEPDPERSLSIRPRAPYQSNYIGVSRKYTGWCGHWALECNKYVCGPVRQSEIEAAQDRARALGLDYLEVRNMEATRDRPRG